MTAKTRRRQLDREPHEETVGTRLRRLRLERGLSQRELALKANGYLPDWRSDNPKGGKHGITYAYVSRIEAGARRPSVIAMRALAQALEVTPDYMEFGDEMKSNPTFKSMQRRIVKLEGEIRRLRRG